jgi:23S rRNA pseudouridine2605 synthase
VLEDNKIRLQKWLSATGVASRRKCEQLIVQGRVIVNNKKAELGQKIDPQSDIVVVDKKEIKKTRTEKKYFIFNKPDHCLVSRVSQGGYKTIYDNDSLRGLTSLNSVGRLDYRTEGLLLLTNDGDFIFKLTHPKFKKSRVYHVETKYPVSDADIKKVNKFGAKLEEGRASCTITKEKRNITPGLHGFSIEIFEGRNRVVRRIFESLSTRVVILKRVSFAGLLLPKNLEAGKIRPLSFKERKLLLS